MNQLNDGAERVQSLLREWGIPHTIVMPPDSARTAQEAADAIGREMAQIAKSILFRLGSSNKPLSRT